MNSSKYLIGADPELFLRRNGHFISAHDLLPGKKHEPHKVSKGAIQVDGVAAEFNIEPAASEEEFLGNIQTVSKILHDTIKKGDKAVELAVIPYAEFGSEYFKALPDNVKELGCDPDFDAYSGDMNQRPTTDRPVRTAAGHIHIGWTKDAEVYSQEHFFDCMLVTKQLDSLLYLPSLLYDDDNRRRSLYGKMGAFRPKDYGVEYRPLSNAWLRTPALSSWIFKSVRNALDLLDNKHFIYEDKTWELYRDKITSGTIGKKDALDYSKYISGTYFAPEVPNAV